MKKEAFIKLANGQKTAVEIQELSSTNAFFAAAHLIVNHVKPCYLEINHEQLNTTIDLTDLTDMVILHLDEKGLMQGATYVLPKSLGSFAIITQSKRLLFLPYPVSFSIDEVKSVSLTH